MWYASDEPIPSTTSTPNASSHLRCSSAGSASPADVHSRSELRSCVDAEGCATIALIIVGTFTRIVGRMPGDQLEDPLDGRAFRERDARAADAERVQRGQVPCVAEEQLRHRQHDVVRADVEHAAARSSRG